MDEGWTRWVLEQYGFNNTPIHNADIKAGKLRERFDAIILADQSPRDILDGFDAPAIRPEYRGGIGEDGLANLKQFVADGGTLVTMGNACDLAIDELPIPVKDIKKGLTRDQHFAPGAILRLEVDTQQPDRLRRGRRDLRVLHQQPVLQRDRRASRPRRRASSRATRTRTSSRRAG